MKNASTNDGVTFTITIIITTIASIITTIAIIITIIVAILHQMRPAQLNSTVPQSNDGSAPAMMMTFNM
jgi:MFS superfamily sulfate permease-like transporter